jgi:hypothetical protein
MRGAGGSPGGLGRFFLGLVMLVAGGYLFLNAITVTNHFGLGRRLFHWGGFNVTSGMVLVPFLFGVGMIFYNAKNWLGWVLTASSIIMLGIGVISNIQFRLRSMSAFELLTILVLLLGGLGLFLSSLRSLDAKA